VTPRPYAQGTTVDVSKSRAEIDALLTRHGATQVIIKTEASRGTVAFEIDAHRYRIEMPLPSVEEVQLKASAMRGWEGRDPSYKTRWIAAELAQMHRERWRALLLVMKSKLEIARICGFSSVEREFLADMVLPNGGTVYGELAESIHRGLSDGMPKMLGTSSPEPPFYQR
jgi:hypothetical protein